MDLPLEDVVLQNIALRRRQARKARLQPTEHVVVFISVADGGEHAGQKAHRRLLQNIAAAAKIDRDVVALKHRLNHTGVVPQVPGRHGDVPKAALSRRRQPQDVRRRLLHLGKHRVRPPQADGGAVPRIRPVLPEEIPLHMAQGRGVPPLQGVRLHRAAVFPCQAAQLVQRFQRGGENLLPAVLLPQQRHGHRPGLAQKHAQGPPLLGIEIGKTVDKNILAQGIGGGLQTVAQLCHPVPRVQTGPAEPGLVGPV